MENFVLIAILLVIVGGAVYYIYKAKKRGDACIGCPQAKQCKMNKKTNGARDGGCGCSCSGSCESGCSCSDHKEK